MTTTTKILIGLFVIIFWACSNSTTQTDESTIDKKLADNYVSNISLVDGKFIIDTIAILNNNNLQSLIADLEKTDLAEKNNVAEIPSFIKSFLDSLIDNFSIANPGEEWKVGCTNSFQDKGTHKINLTKEISPSDSNTLNNYGKEFISIQSKLPNEWTISSIMICEQWIEDIYVRIPISKIEIKFTLKQRQNNPDCNNEITLSFYDICNKQKVLDKTKHLMMIRSTTFPPPPVECFNDKYFVYYWDCYCKYENEKIDNKCVSLKEFIIKHFNLKE